jgi:hypothetical protein
LAVAGEFAEPGGFVFAVGPDQVGAELVVDEGFEVLAGEAFVAEDHLLGVDEMVVAFEQCLGDLAFTDLGLARPPDDGHALGGADQVETNPQKNRLWLTQ